MLAKSLLMMGTPSVLVDRSVLHQPTIDHTSVPVPAPQYDAEVIVVGAGVAGASLSASLGKDGRKVLLLERDLSKPNRIVGELLQPGGVLRLGQLGIAEALEGIDSPLIQGYAIFHSKRRLCLSYPKVTLPKTLVADDDEEPEDLVIQPRGRSFHHGSFVQSLRQTALSQSSVEVRQATVTSMIEDSTGSVIGVSYKQQGREFNVYAPLVVVADGLFSKFRKQIIPEKPQAKSAFIALIIDSSHLPHPDYGHVVLADPAPVLLYPISSTHARVLIDIPNPIPSSADGSLRKFLTEFTAPQLPVEIRQPFLDAVASQTLRSMPCGRLHPNPYNKKGMIMLGDAWNVRHPLTGAGMTAALTDCKIVRDLIRETPDLTKRDEFHSKFVTEFFARRKGAVSIINILAQALYEVFSCSGDPVMADMQEATFRYFELGGFAADGTMSLLACTTTTPLSLVAHFFSVGFLAMGRAVYPVPLPHTIYRAFRIGWVAAKLILPLMYREHIVPLLNYRYPYISAQT